MKVDARERHRRLQDDEGGSTGLSADTIAIVLSVFVGICGYVVQAWTSNKANAHAAILQREHDQRARDQQAEQQRATAQIRRTERWVGGRLLHARRAGNRRVRLL